MRLNTGSVANVVSDLCQISSAMTSYELYIHDRFKIELPSLRPLCRFRKCYARQQLNILRILVTGMAYSSECLGKSLSCSNRHPELNEIVPA